MLAASVNAAIGKAGLMLMLGGATFGIIAVLYGIRSRNQQLQRQSMRYAWLSFAGAVLAVVMMQRALITRDFSMAYVQQVGSADTPALYNFAAMWSALEGSILLWAMILAGFTAAVAWRFRKRADDALVGWAAEATGLSCTPTTTASLSRSASQQFPRPGSSTPTEPSESATSAKSPPRASASRSNSYVKAARDVGAVTRIARSPTGWALVIAVFVGLVAYGSTQTAGPQTQEDRVDNITSKVACPICDGESVSESRNSASRAIRNEVDELVRSKELTDEQILDRIENTYGREVMLVPASSGIDAVAWIAPIIVFMAAAIGLVASFIRWRRLANLTAAPTADDRRIVEKALNEVNPPGASAER